MARALPLYTLEEQYSKLDTDFPSSFPTLNITKYRLLMACSKDGNIDSAKNRFLNLIQDTEIGVTFSSLLEVPITRENIGVNSIYDIHKKYQGNYGLINRVIRELEILGLPKYTLDTYTTYFSSNEDPVYKLSISAAAVMMGYIKDDQINNRKG